MRSSSSPQRYVLVPRTPDSGSRTPVRRFSLARVAVTPRSALGEDRHARMERAAGHDRPAS